MNEELGIIRAATLAYHANCGFSVALEIQGIHGTFANYVNLNHLKPSNTADVCKELINKACVITTENNTGKFVRLL